MLQDIHLQIEMVCARVGLDRQLARELADISIAALGNGFFENPRFKKNPVTHEQALAHPLLKGIADALPEVGTGELIELGLYLRTFAADPAIAEILATLRSDREYESTFFHLAMAYRLGRAGCNPTLEPKTDRGKSDILFTFEDRTYVAECYRVHASLFEHLGKFESLLARRLNHATPPGRKYRFRIHINTPLSYDGMRRMLRRADDLVALFHSREDFAVIQLRHGQHLLGVEDITDVDPDPDFDRPDLPARPLREDEADLVVCSTSVDADNIFSLPDTSAYQTRGSRALVLRGYERAWPKSPYEVLAGKIGYKLKQIKISGSNYGRLLFVEFPWLEVDDRGALWKYKRMRADFMRNFPEVGGILLAERRPLKRHFGYRGAVLPGSEAVEIPKSLIDRLSEVEAQGLF